MAKREAQMAAQEKNRQAIAARDTVWMARWEAEHTKHL